MSVPQTCAVLKTVLRVFVSLHLHRVESACCVDQKQQQLLGWQPALNRARKQDLHGFKGTSDLHFIAA